MTPLENAKAFYREVAATHELWTVIHAEGADSAPTWPAGQGMSIRPFWSSESRAKKMINGPLARRGFKVHELHWDEFVSSIAPAMNHAKQLVGVNWSGPRARGYNIPANDVIRNVDDAIREHA